MLKKKEEHVHKVKMHKYKTGQKIYHCILPDCYFKVEVPMFLGKRTVCHICGDEFIVTEQTLKLQRPHCSGCGRMKVRDEQGNVRYVTKVNDRALVHAVNDSSKDLRSRLDSIINNDEDI